MLFDYDDSNHMITKNSDSFKRLLGIEQCLHINYIHEDFFTDQVNCYPNYCRYITGKKSSGGMNEYGLEVEDEFFFK